MSENIIEIINTDVVVEIGTPSYDLGVENLIVSDYTYSQNKPSINSVLLVGNKTSEDLGLVSVSEMSAKEDVDNKVTAIDEYSTDIQYPSAKCVYDELSGKTDTDLSNLSQTGQTVLDGQWVISSAELISGNASTVDLSPITLDEYLPDDNYKYEVILTGYGFTGTTAGNQQRINVQTDLMTSDVYMWYVITRANAMVIGSGTATLVVGSGKTIQVKGYEANTGTYNLYLRGYRRIGTNS